jgi:3-phenylpropionate/cinnamic acid dioxygenase small subunit
VGELAPRGSVEAIDPALQAEVLGLLAAYGHAIDDCDPDAWARLFHPDGTSSGPGRPTLRGHAELRAWVRDHPRPDLLHTCTNVEVVGMVGEEVHVRSHFVIHRVGPDGAFSVVVAGSYRDVLVRIADRLRFRSRVAVPRTA